MSILGWAGVALATAVVVYASLAAVGAWRWSLSCGRLVARLTAAAVPRTVAQYDVAETDNLPNPVRRYFRLALTDGQPIIHTAELSMRGRFNMRLAGQRWKPFTAAQYVTTNRPGFIWDAWITLFPGLPVRVTDAYISGRGALHPAILGLFSVGDLEGDGDIAKAELMRWFAEAVWYPTALLPSQGVTWVAHDATSASATLTDGLVSLTLLFRFGTDGLIASIHAGERAATLDGVAVMLPWECRVSDYQSNRGMRVPMAGEALYLTPTGMRSYFQGIVTEASYSFHS